MKVPFLNLKAQYDVIAEEVQRSIAEVLSKCAFSGGPYVEAFEEEFAVFCGSKFAAGVGSGTDALWLALLGLGVQPGDEVITVPNSFIATAEAISLCGARPVFVDVKEDSFTMDPELLPQAITKRTKVIIPVHLYGQTADMDPILSIAERHGIAVLEDACQAHGAEYKGRRAGGLGHAACFSFYPGKNLGAYGEAGCVVTKDEELANKIKMLRDHGQSRKYYHDVIGINGRMDGIQGAVLSVKLKYLDSWNKQRRANAMLYREKLAGVAGLKVPKEMEYARHVYHVFAVRSQRREMMRSSLQQSGIDCGVHYPVPIHLQEAYASREEQAGKFPVAELCARELLSLPMFPELTGKEVDYICQEVERHSNVRDKA
ncbi:DegT/DnrJ/EryC1/StrS family aminotransferase [Geomonas paludis]|uniref:DegT/DnrJ/EryC1/StrS family aminotransferase n=1 Tax=Geomonas paludis TaxID=2740185 RepID=A0A6V8N0H1_9BACT|nr:DegT/DnrJ/EryC1/StrS family aminotransferase [Geomonas paludis]UPU37037.1 DegT/DnrJ/EryC1/StrS family aminotransferase [Geomonas paludis]GFO64869.1 glutamine--scyllo-inositol aminotransferase [Geomonas paludis]